LERRFFAVKVLRAKRTRWFSPECCDLLAALHTAKFESSQYNGLIRIVGSQVFHRGTAIDRIIADETVLLLWQEYLFAKDVPL
jgi:hypothetical protein